MGEFGEAPELTKLETSLQQVLKSDYRSSADQLTSERIKLSGPRSLAQHHETLNRKR
jgi:ubiquinone biosynthesis protein UbiJ